MENFQGNGYNNLDHATVDRVYEQYLSDMAHDWNGVKKTNKHFFTPFPSCTILERCQREHVTHLTVGGPPMSESTN